jgi:hypothetical protein
MSGHPTWRKREYPAVRLPESASGNKSQTRRDKYGRSKTSLFRGRVERRLVTREDDSALQALGGLQFMIELAFWAAHPGWPESIVGGQRCIPARGVRGAAETSTGSGSRSRDCTCLSIILPSR